MKEPLSRIYILSFFFTLCISLTAYVNSSYLATSFSETTISILFIIEAVFAIVLLDTVPTLIKHIGNKNTFFIASFFSVLGLFLLHGNVSPVSMAIGFILFLAANTVILFSIDVFIKHYSPVTAMGKSRGLFLLVINTAWIVSPFLSWWIIGNKGFLTLYTLAALILSGVCVFALGNVSNFSEASYSHRSFFKSTKEVWARFDLRVIIIVQFFLQLFYAWMIVYTPLYLISIRGFSYASLGIVFSIMLLPFILLQLPLGIMADRRYGEKEIMSVGFVIMSLSTLIFAFNNHNQLWSFALILFCTRIGAAMVEVMSETYFFKIIGEQEPGLISLFRSISPLAYIVGMSVAIILLPIGGYTVLYSILALLLMIGALVSRYIHDTK